MDHVNDNLLKCHVMDLQTAVSNLNSLRVRAGTLEDLAGAGIIINATGAPWRFITSRMELLRDSLPIIRNIAESIAKICPNAVIITATNPVDPLNYAIRRITGIYRKQILGYSLNDTLRFRMITAQILGVEAARVEGWVVGEHGPHQVALFSSLRVDGQPITVEKSDRKRIIEETSKSLQAYESLRTGRTTGWTSSIGLSMMVSAIVNDSGEIFPCSVILDGEYDYTGLSISLPVALGKNGWQTLYPLKMEPDEEKSLYSSMAYLKEVARKTDEILAN